MLPVSIVVLCVDTEAISGIEVETGSRPLSILDPFSSWQRTILSSTPIVCALLHTQKSLYIDAIQTHAYCSVFSDGPMMTNKIKNFNSVYRILYDACECLSKNISKTPGI